MKVAVLGDLHLTAHPLQDKHWFSAERLQTFLGSVARAHDRVVIVGDLVQADYGRQLGASADVWRAACERYRDALDVLSLSETTVLRGNHDRVDVPYEQVKIDLGLGTLVAEHGDRIDSSVSGFVPFFTMWLMGRLRLLGLRRTTDVFETLLSAAHRLVLGQKFELEAQRLIEDGAKVVVMGHSHVRKCLAIDVGVYLNAGACTQSSPCFASVDTEQRLAAMNKYRFSDGTFEQLSAVRLA